MKLKHLAAALLVLVAADAGVRQTAAQAGKKEAAGRMEKRAGELQARMEQLLAFQTRAGEIAVAVRDLHEFAKQARTPQEIVERMGPVEERVGQAQEEARANDFDDVAHDISGLKEMLATLRRKLEGK